MVAAATLCKEQTTQATCKTTAGCGWSSTSGTCSQCSTGQFSTNNDTICKDCENAPTGSKPIYTNQAGWNNINCPWDAICPRGTVPDPYDIPTECASCADVYGDDTYISDGFYLKFDGTEYTYYLGTTPDDTKITSYKDCYLCDGNAEIDDVTKQCKCKSGYHADHDYGTSNEEKQWHNTHNNETVITNGHELGYANCYPNHYKITYQPNLKVKPKLSEKQSGKSAQEYDLENSCYNQDIEYKGTTNSPIRYGYDFELQPYGVYNLDSNEKKYMSCERHYITGWYSPQTEKIHPLYQFGITARDHETIRADPGPNCVTTDSTEGNAGYYCYNYTTDITMQAQWRGKPFAVYYSDHNGNLQKGVHTSAPHFTEYQNEGDAQFCHFGEYVKADGTSWNIPFSCQALSTTNANLPITIEQCEKDASGNCKTDASGNEITQTLSFMGYRCKIKSDKITTIIDNTPGIQRWSGNKSIIFPTQNDDGSLPCYDWAKTKLVTYRGTILKPGNDDYIVGNSAQNLINVNDNISTLSLGSISHLYPFDIILYPEYDVCPAGYYCANGQVKDCPENATCPAGSNTFTCNERYYKDARLGQCTACPENATCPAGSTTFTCNAGYYKNAKLGQCTACPENATCPAGSITFTCDKGYYKNGTNGTECEACSDGKTTKTTGQESENACYYESGELQLCEKLDEENTPRCFRLPSNLTLEKVTIKTTN